MKRVMAAGAAATLAGVLASGTATAQSALPTGPVTRILAIGTFPEGTDMKAARAVLPEEVRATVGLYFGGKIDQWFSLADRTGVVFLLNVTKPSEARSMLETLPLGRAHLMHFDLLPLAPLAPLRNCRGCRREHPEPTDTQERPMPFIETHDGVQLFYKDWGPDDAPPIVFHHGWPLSADDWDAQMMFFLASGFRVIAHDRRGHGRSSQTDTGNEMDTYATDVAALTDHLDLHDAVHVGHSTGGGEVARYVARSKPGRVAKAVLIGAVPPIMLKTEANPGGLPLKVFDGFRAALVANRAQFFLDVPTGPFYGFNRPGARISEGVIRNWWRQAMMGGAKAHYDCIKAFSETDFTDDLTRIVVPTLVMHGDDDQIVPYANAAPLAVKLLRNGRLKTFPGLPHGMCTTHPEMINAELLSFVRG